ncbi:hypothetical protein ABZ215_40795 [Amycolatopsis sp. NPDC006131]|uniref:hypothetical protein n=1 Tax=Amycolatopsis sp. NPDC006131 TaxID=3156731 RepID=UPI0033A6AA57
MSCQVAGPLGAQAADTVLSRIAGTEPPVLDVGLVGSCVSLGRHAAVRQFARKDDTAQNFHVGGRLGAAYKELTCELGVLKIRPRGPQARFPAVGEGRTAGHRPSDRSRARNSDSYSFAGSVTCGPRCP